MNTLEDWWHKPVSNPSLEFPDPTPEKGPSLDMPETMPTGYLRQGPPIYHVVLSVGFSSSAAVILECYAQIKRGCVNS